MWWAGAITAGTAAIGATVVVGNFVAGTPGKKVSEREAIAEANAVYAEQFQKSNPIGKFTMQFIEPTVISIGRFRGDNGLRSVLSTGSYKREFGSACLANTAYDMSMPGTSSVPEIGPTSTNTLLLTSESSRTLQFSGLSDGSSELRPADDQTRRIIDAYSC